MNKAFPAMVVTRTRSEGYGDGSGYGINNVEPSYNVNFDYGSILGIILRGGSVNDLERLNSATL